MQKVYISKQANNKLVEYLRSKGLDIYFIEGSKYIDSPISMHPDIYMCKLKDKIFFGEEYLLSSEYPNDVLYNAACVGEYIVCSKYTSPMLINESALKPLIVPQGYVKCNLVVLDDTHVITEDVGIGKALEGSGIDCLVINPHEVKLTGYPYGFIGGASGRIGNEIVFNGDITKHSDFGKIKEYIECIGLSIKSFDYPLEDIGSIIAE